MNNQIKLNQFWKYDLNSHTGWGTPARLGKKRGLPTYKKNLRDQASQFKPEGF